MRYIPVSKSTPILRDFPILKFTLLILRDFLFLKFTLLILCDFPIFKLAP
jgi:hypothetical protein